MNRLTIANIVLLVAGLGLTVLGVVLLVIDGDETEQPPTPDPYALPETREDWVAEGEKLIAQHNCNFCHRTEVPKDETHIGRDNCQSCHQYHKRPENLAPPLDSIAERRTEEWIRRYIKYPYRIRQNSPDRMPDLMLSDREIEVLTRYLMIQAEQGINSLPSWEPVREEKPDAARIEKGWQLFNEHQCATCHTLGDHVVKPEFDLDGNVKSMPVIFAPDLSKVWNRSRPEAVATIIQHPVERMPWSGMATTPVNEETARELAWFIYNAVPPPKHTVSHNDVVGIMLRRCNGCHYGPDKNAQPASNPEGGAGWLATWGAKPRKLDLMSYEGIMQGAVNDLGQRRPVVVPYAENSPLLMHIKGLKQPLMPFGGDPLPDEEIAKIEKWILSGAKGPADSGGITVNPPIEMGD